MDCDRTVLRVMLLVTRYAQRVARVYLLMLQPMADETLITRTGT